MPCDEVKMDDRIRKIIEAGIMAPSGDNCQPWRIQVAGGEIRLYNVPERDTSLFNYQQRASLIAHGAVIENMLIAATALGFPVEVSCFPEPGNEQYVARFSFGDNSSTYFDGGLYPSVQERTTNRKKYHKVPLGVEDIQALADAGNIIAGVSTQIYSGETERSELADVIALNDRIVFENRTLHAFLFEHIRWSYEEARLSRDGLDLKTLELAFPDSLAFPMLKSYELVSILNIFGMSRVIAANARKLALSAAGLGVIAVPELSAAGALLAGRAMQRVWLEATRRGLSFQLMTGIACLMRRVLEGDHGTLSDQHCRLIRAASGRLQQLCSSKSAVPHIIFRVGKSGPPSARSLRLPLEDVSENCPLRA